jgi:hypothetical protein
MTRFPPIFLNKFTAMNKLNIGTNGAQQWIKKRIKIIKKSEIKLGGLTNKMIRY